MREGWSSVAIGCVVRQVRRSVPVRAGVEYPLLGMHWYGEGPFLRETVTADSAKARVYFQVRAGDFLYNRLFAWKGSFGVVPERLAGFYVSGEFPVFETVPELALTEYINLVMCRPVVWEQILRESTGSTATSRNRWNESRFLEWEIPLPPLAEQRRIVDLVVAVDRARVDSQVADAYGAAAGAIMGEATASASDWTTLASVVSKARAGGTPSRQEAAFFGGRFPWLKSGEVEADWIDRAGESLTEHGLANSSAWIMPSGTIVVAMYGQGLTAGSVGYVAVPMAANQAVLGLVPDADRVDPRFLFHWLRSRKESLRGRRSGSSQPNLNKETVLQEPVPIVELDRQRIVAGVLDALSETASESTKVTDAAVRVRKALLADLLSGDRQIPASYDRFLVGAV